MTFLTKRYITMQRHPYGLPGRKVY